MKTVVVTGVSTGIGWGTTKVLTKAGFHVFGSVRKQADGARPKQEFGAKFTPLLFDVTDVAAVKRGADEVRAALKGETLFGLVNNAGIAVSGPLLELPLDEFRRQMEVNLTGPLIVTQAFARSSAPPEHSKGRPAASSTSVPSAAGRPRLSSAPMPLPNSRLKVFRRACAANSCSMASMSSSSVQAP